jgi:hypothetical protein
MRFSTLIPIVSSLSLCLAHNRTGLGSHFWNATTAQPNTTSSGFVLTTDSSSLELVATIQIQIGNLSGSGVISLAPVTDPVELGDPPISPSNTSSLPDQGEIAFTTCPNSSLPNATAAPPYQNSSALNFNITGGNAIPRFSAGPTPTISPTGLGPFTGSGVQSRRLPHMPIFLSAILVWLL